jgi:hypothetical protein
MAGKVLPFLVWEAGPKPKEPPRPKQWEWERLSSLVHDERWQIELVTGGAAYRCRQMGGGGGHCAWEGGPFISDTWE